MRTFLKPLSFIPALLLMYMIFSFSGQTGDVSSQLSFQVSCKIVEAGDYLFDANLEQWQIEDWASRINFITRKLAHMAEYFALAVAVSFPLYVYGMHGILLMLTAGILCVGFACADEYHQAFVAGRSPAARDVVIDSIGVFFGIVVVRIIGWTGRKTIFRPKKKKVKQQKIKQTSAKRPKIKNKNKNVTYQDGPIYNVPPYQGDYRQAPPYQGQAAGNQPHSGWQPYQNAGPYGQGQPYPNGNPYGQGQPYQGGNPYQQGQPYPNGNPYGQSQGQPYQNGNPYYQGQPYPNGNPYGQGQPYQGGNPSPSANGSYDDQDMPFSDDPYVNPNYQTGAPYQEAPRQNAEGDPYYAGEPPYGQDPYQDPYQDPNFSVQPPEEEWISQPSDTRKPVKKKKKKEKDWFFDM